MPVKRGGVVGLDAGEIVLGPVGDATLAVVAGDLVYPPFPEIRHVTDDARGGESGEIAHDLVLQLLCLPQRDPPVLGIRDHVAHVEVVRADAGLIEEREAEVEQLLLIVVDPAHRTP